MTASVHWLSALLVVGSALQPEPAGQTAVGRATAGDTVRPLVSAPRRALGAPSNDDCESVEAFVLRLGVPATFVGDNSGATNDCTGLAGGHVWEAFTIPAPAAITIDYCGTTPPFGNAYRRIMASCPCSHLLPLADFEFDSCPDGNVTLTWPALPAGTYYYPVLNDPNNGSVGPYQIRVVARPLPVGACCVAGACYADLPERACAGRWSEGNACAPQTFSPPCGAVACCTPQGIGIACTDDLPEECSAGGGTTHGLGLCADGFDCTLAVCSGAMGECSVGHPTAGCADRSCCAAICEADPFCCDVEWDASCALGAAASSACVPTPAPWSAHFDQYTAGLELHGVDGWAGWDNDPQLAGFVTALAARSVPHAVRIQGNADQVRTFSGINEGRWTLRLWQYIPGTLIGEQFLIVMNTYQPGGGARINRWSAQLGFNGGDGTLRCDCGSGSSAFRPFVSDAWVEIRLDLDLDEDWVDLFYDGEHLAGYRWSAGPFAANTDGQTAVAAIDLFANGSSFIYYDDLSLAPDTAACPPSPIEWRDPPNGAVDARQPHPIDDPTTPQGTTTVMVHGPRAADPTCWTLCDSGLPPANAITSATSLAGGMTALTLLEPVRAGTVTTLYYDGAQPGRFIAHPGNINGDSATAGLDLLALIDVLNGAADPPWATRSTDVDHSGALTPSDLLTAIDLLNGANAFDAWNGSALPDNTTCP